jgi:hypothetical protein
VGNERRDFKGQLVTDISRLRGATSPYTLIDGSGKTPLSTVSGKNAGGSERTSTLMELLFFAPQKRTERQR